MRWLYIFFEEMLFSPKWYHLFFILLLLPFSLIYFLIVFFKFPKKFKNMQIPVISIGNLVIGGSGKTPLSIFLANKFEKYKPAVILRGYGRESKGLLVVSRWGDVLVDVKKSGDEAMEIATSTKALVIVSEDREEGIKKAKSLGACFVILDDGFDKPFLKLNIIIDYKPKNPFLLPAGPYRYPRHFLKYGDIVLKEGRNFKREVVVPDGDILISGISKPKRLLKWWEGEYKFFPDHYNFKREDFRGIEDKKIVVTKKDFVKLKDFGLNLEIMELRVWLEDEVLEKIEKYLIKFQKKG